MTQLGKVAIGLLVESGATLKGLGGEALHAFLFRILRQYSSELASKIHNQKEQRPFSLNPPLGDYELRRGYMVVSPGTTLTFGLALLCEELLAGSISAFLSALQEGQVLSLSRKPVILQNLDLCAGSFSSFSKILSDASTLPVITLEFVTPTSFRKNEIQAVFPEPELVFPSLLKRWNTFSELKVPEEYAETFPSIKVANYNLRTELIHFSTYKIIGFKGRVEYRLPQKSPEPFRQAINALADFAFYAGIGVKTAMGMGQVERVN